MCLALFLKILKEFLLGVTTGHCCPKLLKALKKSTKTAKSADSGPRQGAEKADVDT